MGLTKARDPLCEFNLFFVMQIIKINNPTTLACLCLVAIPQKGSAQKTLCSILVMTGWAIPYLPIKSKHADKSSKLEKVMHHTASQGQCLSLAGNPTPPTIRCVCKRLVYICISKLCPSWARSSLTKALYGLEKLIEFLVDDKEEALMCTFTFTSDRVPHACSNLNNSLG